MSNFARYVRSTTAYGPLLTFSGRTPLLRQFTLLKRPTRYVNIHIRICLSDTDIIEEKSKESNELKLKHFILHFLRPSYVALSKTEVFDPEDDEDEVEEELVLDPDELKNIKQLYGKIQLSLKDNHLMKLNLIIFSSQLN